MKTKTIAKVNNVDIVSTNDEQMVAIKPICEALGIDYKVQWQKIKDDEDLSATMVLNTTVAADGKEREMCCLPVRYIFGWLFTINPANVKPEAKEAVRNYRKMYYDVLYEHFFGSQQKQLEQNQIEINLLENIAKLDQQKAAINCELSEMKRKLNQLREERLKNEPSLF